MKTITLLDTSVATTNLGDEIIMDAVNRHARELFPGAFTYRVASHENMGARSRDLIERADVTLAGGTNLLASYMWRQRIWKLTPRDIFATRDVTLMGVGWFVYSRKPDPYTQTLLRSVLSPTRIHSVRDEYTKQMLQSTGIERVLNTGCPTLWHLDPEHCASIPVERSEDVLCTLNTYQPNPALDGKLLEVLHQNYRKVYFWVQTATDLEYSRTLSSDLDYIDPSLRGLDEILESESSLDYVGNRLHAGIRALQKKRRSVIVSIDNRAREMGKSFSLPIVERDDFDGLKKLIASPFETRIQLANDTIREWKDQFAD